MTKEQSLRYDVVQPENANLPPRVSFSQMSKYNQCGLRFYFSYVTSWREPQTISLVVGSITHEAIEHLYRLPQEERTVDRALELVREHGMRMLKMNDYKPFATDNEMKNKVDEAVKNLFTLENPQELVVQPEHLEMELEVQINGVRFFGKIDRFTQDGTARVTDYKTGKLYKPNNVVDESKFNQPYLYALAFKELHDIDIEEVELIFLHAKDVLRRTVEQNRMLQLGEDLATMHSESHRDLVESAWTAKRSNLCGSCAFNIACPLVTPDAPKPGTPESDELLRGAGLFQR